MEETDNILGNSTAHTIRIAANTLAVILICCMFYKWSGSQLQTLYERVSNFSAAQEIAFLFDIVIVLAICLAYARINRGRYAMVCGAMLMLSGRKTLGGVTIGGTLFFMIIASAILFFLSEYYEEGKSDEEYHNMLVSEIRMWTGVTALSMIVIGFIGIESLWLPSHRRMFDTTGFTFVEFIDVLLAILPFAVAVFALLIAKKRSRLSGILYLALAIFIYLMRTDVLQINGTFLTMSRFIVCGGLFLIWHRMKPSVANEISAGIATKQLSENDRNARAAKDLTLGRVYGALMILLFADHIWIDAKYIFTENASVAINTMNTLLYVAATAGVVISLFRGWLGLRILLATIIARMVWFIPNGASDGATLFIALSVGLLAAFYLLRAEDALPGLTPEENKESHATDVRFLARILSIAAVVYFLVRFFQYMSVVNDPKYHFEALSTGYVWIPFLGCIVMALIAQQDEIKGGLILIIVSFLLMAVGDTVENAHSAYVAGFTFFIAGAGYVASFFMHAALPEPIEEETTDMEGGDVELPS